MSQPRPRRWRAVAVLAILALVISIGAGLSGWRWAGSERADLAQWLMASAAILTLLAATSAAVFAAGAFRIESNREQQWRDDQRRAQAALVAAWPTGQATRLQAGNDYMVAGRFSGPLVQAEIVLRNASDVPVTNVELEAVVEVSLGAAPIGGYRLGTAGLSLIPPGGNGDQLVRISQVEESKTHSWQLTEAAHGRTLNFIVRVDIMFTDAAGVDWRRTSSGFLYEMRARHDGFFPRGHDWWDDPNLRPES